MVHQFYRVFFRGEWRDTRDVYYLLFDFSISRAARSQEESERCLFGRKPRDFVITVRTHVHAARTE
jgi:hypothetical protein